MPRDNGYELLYKGKEPAEKVLSTRPMTLLPVKAFGKGASWPNLLVSGDNLPALRTLLDMKRAGRVKNADGSDGARLVYIDPPFSTNLEFRSRSKQKAYRDKLVGAEFIESLRKRLILLRELLSEDGSIYVHLDWKKAHYVKAVLDEVFGEENFLNDIIWSYGGRGAKAIAGQFSRNHDIILWYRKGGRHVFNQLTVERRIKKEGSGFKKDEAGRWFKTSPRGDYTDDSIKALSKEGRVHRTRNGNIRIKYFLREDGDSLIEERLVGDVWDDIPDAMHIPASEKTGYPTQKPEALLARIIRASSNPGDIVLDAFAGAGTTLTVAEKLGRRWVGIDSGRLSIHTIEKRLLTIRSSKGLVGPVKSYNRGCAPFIVLQEGECAVHAERQAPTVRCAYSINDATNECVVRLKGFSSVQAREKGLEGLSSVMVDTGFDGEVFCPDLFFDATKLKEMGYELRLPLNMVKGEVMFVYADISGNERWFVGEVV